MYLELSYVLGPGASYPDSPPDAIQPVERTASGDPANTTMVHHFLHNGTHLDTPFHFDPTGDRIEQLPLEAFIFEAPVLVEVVKGPGEAITRDDLAARDLARADLLFIRTGFDALRRTDRATFRVMYPGFTLEAARYLRAELPRLKAVAIDFISLDGYLSGPRTGYQVHHALLDRNASTRPPVLAIEDVNLAPLVGRTLKRAFALPIRFQGTEAAPVCVVAEVD
jgi:arylformamidase